MGAASAREGPLATGVILLSLALSGISTPVGASPGSDPASDHSGARHGLSLKSGVGIELAWYWARFPFRGLYAQLELRSPEEPVALVLEGTWLREPKPEGDDEVFLLGVSAVGALPLERGGAFRFSVGLGWLHWRGSLLLEVFNRGKGTALPDAAARPRAKPRAPVVPPPVPHGDHVRPSRGG